jgi:3-carboxy-cis,cis-muconate cycloisomerase
VDKDDHDAGAAAHVDRAAAGLAVADALARRLGLPAATPWHTNRSRIVELAAALGEAAGAAGKVGTDVVLLAQTEVGEVAEGGGGGGSSTLPHKRNPAGAVTAVAAARRTPALVATLFAAMPAEEERAAGAWQSEPEALDDLLRLTGTAVAAIRRSLESLEVFPDRMRANLDLTNGLVMAESLAAALGKELGRADAQALVAEISKRAAVESRALAEVAAEAPELGTDGILAALDPASYLGATDELIDRALAAHHDRVNPR